MIIDLIPNSLTFSNVGWLRSIALSNLRCTSTAIAVTIERAGATSIEDAGKEELNGTAKG